MEGLTKRTITTQRSLQYTYYVSPSGESTRQHPSLLFVHGFPDSAHLWAAVIANLGEIPNKIIIPDCLGYGGTDKPEDAEVYAYHGQADDLVEILSNEGAEFTVIIGHDWGSPVVQRTYLHHREQFSGVVLVNTGYMVPSDQAFDLAAVNRLTEQSLGYPQFSYWEFLLAPDASNIIDQNLERMWQLMHGDVEEWMKKLFCVPNAMREFILSDEQVPLKPYSHGHGWKEEFMLRFKTHGFASALKMYEATASNIQSRSDSILLKRSLAIEVPILLILASEDAVCVPEMMDPAKNQGLVPKLKEVVVESGHWLPMEKPGELAAHIKAFLTNLP